MSNDMSDDETGLQTPRVFLSTTSHGCNSGNSHKDNRICLYQPQDYKYFRITQKSRFLRLDGILLYIAPIKTYFSE